MKSGGVRGEGSRVGVSVRCDGGAYGNSYILRPLILSSADVS